MTRAEIDTIQMGARGKFRRMICILQNYKNDSFRLTYTLLLGHSTDTQPMLDVQYQTHLGDGGGRCMHRSLHNAAAAAPSVVVDSTRRLCGHDFRLANARPIGLATTFAVCLTRLMVPAALCNTPPLAKLCVLCYSER